MKKRYAIELTVENYERFLAVATKIGMPRKAIHSIIDESFAAVITSMEKFANKGKVTMADLFTMIGEQLDEIQTEEVKRNEANSIPARSARIIKKRKEKKSE